MFTPLTLRALFFVFLGHFCVDFMIGIWPVFKTMVKMDLALAGAIAGGSAFVGEGLQFLFGSLADRGYQRALILCGIVFAGCSAFLPFAVTFLGCFALYFGTCLASGAFHPTANALLGGLTLENRNVIMALFSTFGMLGLACSQISFTWVVTSLHGNSFLLALPPVLLALAAYFWLPKQKLAEGHTRKAVSLRVFWKFLQDPQLRTLYIILISNQIASWSLLFLLPDFLQSRGFDSWIVFGGGHLCYVLGAACMPPVLGYFADKSSPRKIIFMLTLLSTTVFSLLIMSQGISQSSLFLLLFMLGGFAGGVSPIIWSLGNQLVTSNRGMISAFLMGFAWMFSEAFGIGISGVLANFFIDDAPAKALGCMGCTLFGAIYFSLKLPEPVAKTNV